MTLLRTFIGDSAPCTEKGLPNRAFAWPEGHWSTVRHSSQRQATTTNSSSLSSSIRSSPLSLIPEGTSGAFSEDSIRAPVWHRSVLEVRHHARHTASPPPCFCSWELRILLAGAPRSHVEFDCHRIPHGAASSPPMGSSFQTKCARRIPLPLFPEGLDWPQVRAVRWGIEEVAHHAVLLDVSSCLCTQAAGGAHPFCAGNVARWTSSMYRVPCGL